MNKINIKSKIKNSSFDYELVDEIVKTNDFDIFLLALERSDCPPELLVDLSQCPSDKVRKKIAAHRSTPKITLERMCNDNNPDVAKTALSRVDK